MDTADTRPYRYPELKAVIYLLFPGIATAYFFIWTVYDFPNPEWVFGVLAFLNIGVVILMEFLRRADGSFIITEQDDEKVIFTLELDTDPMELRKKKNITFTVVERPKGFVDFEAFLEGEGPESQTKHPL